MLMREVPFKADIFFFCAFNLLIGHTLEWLNKTTGLWIVVVVSGEILQCL
jgi:hypothetical protein